MDTINIYRLYDPLAIQQLKLTIEAAAVACPTAGLMPGYAICTILDNGFWTLENQLTQLGASSPTLKTIEEAAAAAQVCMKDLDIAMQGGKPTRALNAYEKAYDWNTVNPKYHPPQLTQSGAASKSASTGKPKFFEYANYIGGRSMSYQKDGKTYKYWRLLYGIQVKPSKDENTVMVEDVEIQVEMWASGSVKFVLYNVLPIKKTEVVKRIGVANAVAGYLWDEDMNTLFPYLIEQS